MPLNRKQNILVAGDAADNIGKQSGGWSVTWQGTGNSNAEFPGATSIYAGIDHYVSESGGQVELAVDGEYQNKPDVAIVVFGEEPYAEGNGDINNLEYQRGNKRDLALLRKLQSKGIPVVSIFIPGRPLWINSELNASDAFVAAWLPGTEGGGIAEVIFSDENNEVNYNFNGKLSFSWSATAIQILINRHDKDYQPLLPYGFGLRYGEPSTLANDLDETVLKADETLTALAIFDRRPMGPFSSRLLTAEGEVKITSSLVKHGALTFKTTDKVVQEDARQLTFDGTDTASYSINSNFSEDLRPYQEAQSVLYFDVRVTQKPTERVLVSMYCESEDMRSCEGKLDISEQLSGLPEKEWQPMSIDSKCFIAAGADMSSITTVFELTTAGELGVTLANIRLVPQEDKNTATPCS